MIWSLFKRRPKAPKPPRPNWGDFRIIRRERAGGEVSFVIERFGSGWYHERPEWTSSFHACYGPYANSQDTLELAKAVLQRWQQEQRDRVVVSETVVAPANPPTGASSEGRG